MVSPSKSHKSTAKEAVRRTGLPVAYPRSPRICVQYGWIECQQAVQTQSARSHTPANTLVISSTLIPASGSVATSAAPGAAVARHLRLLLDAGLTKPLVRAVLHTRPHGRTLLVAIALRELHGVYGASRLLKLSSSRVSASAAPRHAPRSRGLLTSGKSHQQASHPSAPLNLVGYLHHVHRHRGDNRQYVPIPSVSATTSAKLTLASRIRPREAG